MLKSTTLAFGCPSNYYNNHQNFSFALIRSLVKGSITNKKKSGIISGPVRKKPGLVRKITGSVRKKPGIIRKKTDPVCKTPGPVRKKTAIK